MKLLLFAACFLFVFNNSSVADECNIVYGLHDKYKPYEWINDKGVPEGMNIELLDAMAKKAGCDYEIKTFPWPEMLSALIDGRINMVSSSLTEDREQFLMQLPHSTVLYRYLFNRIGSPYISSLDELNGKTILGLSGGVGTDYFKSIAGKYNMNVVEYPTHDDVIKALSSGFGDAAVSTLIGVMNVLESTPYDNIRITGYGISPSVYGFLLNKKDTELYRKLDAAMTELKTDGRYFEILKKWSKNHSGIGRWLYYLAVPAGILILVFLLVMLWNKSLHLQVRKKSESLAKLRDEALMAGRLAAIGEMAASVVHEINNPTGIIIHNTGFLDEFRKRTESFIDDNIEVPESERFCGLSWEESKIEAASSAKAIGEGLERIKSTTADLKNFGKARQDKYELIDLRECLETSIKLTAYFVKKYTVAFSVQYENIPQVFGNRLHIEQTVVNLIQNACYALTDKKQAIECGLCMADNGKYVKLYVKDYGCGMASEIVKKACEPFFTTRKDSGGTGLGLSVTARVMKEHSGRLEIYSKEGVGTEIGLYFPVSMGKEG